VTTDTFVFEDRDGILAGPVRRPVNFSRDAKGSIHDDATAQTLGFRGGTVAGNIHFEQYTPLMLERFGAEWRRRGGLSLHFVNATTDGEPVQVFAGPVEEVGPDLRRAMVWMETPEGVRVNEGTAWVGGNDPDSTLRKRIAAQRPANDLRILKSSKVGDSVRDVPSRLDSAKSLLRVEQVTEMMPEYRDASVFGERVAAPAVRAVEGPLYAAVTDFVGMFGAIELQYLDGPIFLDHDYLADAAVIAVGESPKTEVTWYESTLRDAKDGRVVARMLMMSRVLKASSPLWA
jgi:hypothetical protein